MMNTLPTDEEISLDRNLKDFVQVDGDMYLSISFEEKSISSYAVNIKSRFYNTVPQYCSLVLAISKVTEKSTGSEIKSYSSLFTYDDTSGLFTLLDFSTPYTNYQVFFNASYCILSSDFPFLVDISITQIYRQPFVPNF